MSYQQSYYSFGPRRVTDGIKSLIIANVLIFLVTYMSRNLFYIVTNYFGVVPYDFWHSFRVWQPVTYLFLHGSFFHVGMNMLVLWMFGSELEMTWGKHFFMRYYMITGIGAGLLTILFQPLSEIPVIGASGAIYGVLLAYGLMYPEREVYLYFLFPIKVKYFVALIGVMAFISSLGQGAGDNIAHITHLGGMIIGYYYLKLIHRSGNHRRGKLIFNPFKLRTFTDIIASIRRLLRMEIQKRQKQNSSKAEIDEILDKISRVGYSGLTEEEKRRLLEVSSKLSKDKTEN